MTDIFLASDAAFQQARSDFHDRCRFHFGPTHPLVIPLIVQDDIARERHQFYQMVRKHLSNCEATPSEPKGKKARRAERKKESAAPAQVEVDGIPVEKGKTQEGKDINLTADAMQWLIMKGHLNSQIVGDRTEKALEIAWSEGRGRINTATKLADIFEKAELTPLRSPDFEAVPCGGFGPRSIGTSKFRCISILADLGEDVPAPCMEILRAIICRNELVWHGASKGEQKQIMQDIRMALDFASWSLDKHHPKAEMTEDELCRRWPQARDWFTARRLRGATESFKMDRPGA